MRSASWLRRVMVTPLERELEETVIKGGIGRLEADFVDQLATLWSWQRRRGKLATTTFGHEGAARYARRTLSGAT